MQVLLVSRSFDVGSGQGVFRAAGELRDGLKALGIEVRTVAGTRLNDALFAARTFLTLSGKEERVHFLMPEYALALLRPRIREKAVVTVHDCIPFLRPERKLIYTVYSRFTYYIARRAHVIHVPSKWTATTLHRILSVPFEKIRVIPWGVDVKKYERARKLRKKREEERLVVGYLGGLGPRKNVEWIVRAATELPDAKFIIAGSGKRRQSLEALATKLGIKNVNFVGFVPEEQLPEFYASLDVFVFPSQFEGFGFPVVEALAAGVPYVIAGNTGVALELPVLRARNYEQFLDMLRAVVQSGVEPIKHGWRIVERRFNPKKVVLNFVRMYDEIL